MRGDVTTEAERFEDTMLLALKMKPRNTKNTALEAEKARKRVLP